MARSQRLTKSRRVRLSSAPSGSAALPRTETSPGRSTMAIRGAVERSPDSGASRPSPTALVFRYLSECFVVQVDANGGIDWQMAIPSTVPGGRFIVDNVEPAPGGGWTVTGVQFEFFAPPGESKYAVVRLDSAG